MPCPDTLPVIDAGRNDGRDADCHALRGVNCPCAGRGPLPSGLFGEDRQGRRPNQEQALKGTGAPDAGCRRVPGSLWAKTIGRFGLHARRKG